jgi:hypothetical protein
VKATDATMLNNRHKLFKVNNTSASASDGKANNI